MSAVIKLTVTSANGVFYELYTPADANRGLYKVRRRSIRHRDSPLIRTAFVRRGLRAFKIYRPRRNRTNFSRTASPSPIPKAQRRFFVRSGPKTKRTFSATRPNQRYCKRRVLYKRIFRTYARVEIRDQIQKKNDESRA